MPCTVRFSSLAGMVAAFIAGGIADDYSTAPPQDRNEVFERLNAG